MRAVKILGLALAGLVLVVVLLLAGVWLFVDPNDYKDRIAAGVKSSTGRDLALAGELKLTVFPWVGLAFGPATLGNPPGFGEEPFATVQHASLRVKLLPLLRQRLEVGRIRIEGLDLRLKQDAQGKGNWEFGDAGEVQADATPEGPARPLELEGLTITDSRVSFDELVAQDLNVEIGRVAPGASIPVAARLVLVTEAGASPLPLQAAFELTVDPAGERYRLAPLALEGSLPVEGAQPVAWTFAAPEASVDLAAQTLAQTTFTARFGAAQLTGNVSGTRLVDEPRLGGDFRLQPVDPRQLIAQLGIAPPVTRDGKVLGSLAAAGKFTYAGDEVGASDLDVKLDDSTLAGRFGTNLDTGAMSFDLTLDRIDADRYLPPPSESAAEGDEAPFELPVETLKALNARGTLAVAQARALDLTLANLTVGIDAKDGVTRIAPARAQLYGGQYSGEITVDTRPAQPKLTIAQTMTGLDIARFMADFMDVKRLSGKGNVTANLAATGRSGDALVKSLNGKVSANLADGAVEGVDLWYAIAQAQSLLQKRTLAAATNSGRTAFDTFRTSANIANGVATTDDLAIASQQLRVTGKGTSNLATQAIDYQVTATVLKAPPGAEADVAGLTLAAIPVNITGTFEEPKVRPDLEGLAKARLKQEVDRQKDKIEEKVREKVQDRLKNLLNR